MATFLPERLWRASYFALLMNVSVLCIWLLFILTSKIRNVYFHPLSHIPGPKLWIAFPFLRHLAAIRGVLDARLLDFHNRYGPVVRYQPNEVSFTTAAAFRDIYGHGHSQLPKNVQYKAHETPDIIFSNDEDHSRYRKALAHAFSEKGLRDQEPIIRGYVDCLMDKLKLVARTKAPTDMVRWYTLSTFDLIGDLTFGESFHGLESGIYPDWVDITFQSMKVLPFIRAAHVHPFLMWVVRWFLPAPIVHARDRHRKRTRESVVKRVDNAASYNRGDFMDSMLKHHGTKEGLSVDELISNSNILIVGGSETTATLLSGVTYLLLSNPATLAKAAAEVRQNFDCEADITFVNASNRLPYMLACLNEAMRIYPPLPTASQRTCVPGTVISGHELPAGTKVAVPHLATFRSPLNFHDPLTFAPERWLPSFAEPSSPYRHDNKDAFQPFMCGPRNCIGRNLAYNEMRLILARMLWNFDLKLCEQSREWMEGQRTWIIWEKRPLWCEIRVRDGL